jgi:7-keto-8-aminopelargonate synthetase-like enzyme
MKSKFVETASQVVNYSVEQRVAHLNTLNIPFNKNKINTTEGSLVNFSLCDYLSLSTDKRIIESAVKSIRNNGVYTAISRTYLKLGIYEEAEQIIADIFKKPVLLLPRTTLGHITALPIIIDKNDAVILDQQVHTSVRIATDMLQTYGIHVETIKHNNLNQLQDKINALKNTKNKIWYMADGVYSMFGDCLPAKEIKQMLDDNEQLYLYADDAHGMSWKGENGNGLVLSEIGYHPKLFLTTSLGKGFGAGGGALVCPDKKTKDMIALLGAPLMFTSPVEPSTLGSIIASAKIHLSQEIIEKQNKLALNIEYFYRRAKELGLPVVDSTPTPIALMATIKPDIVIDIGRRMFDKGFHLTGGVFPSVPFNSSGVRVTISLYQSIQDIENLLNAFSISYEEELKKRKMDMEQIFKHFKIPY